MGGGWNIGQYGELNVPPKKPGVEDDVMSSPDSLPEPERPPLRHIDKYIRPECPCLSKRVSVALLSCIGFIIMFGMRTSMSIVKLEYMREQKDEEKESSSIQSAEDSAIFWGYFITQIPGGLIAAAYPANKLFGLAIGTSSFLNLLIPAAYGRPQFLIIIKVLQGLVEGVTYPACHGIMRYWAPPLERSRLATLAFTGCYAGVMFAMLISGVLTAHVNKNMPFYFYGCAGLIWYASWLWLVFEKPEYHPTIDAKELHYIQSSLGSSSQNYVHPSITNTPWKSFFTSMPCYAIFVANFCRSWNFYLLVLFQAQYFQEVYTSDNIDENTLTGALPHFLMTVIVPTGGILADRLRKRGILNTTQVRKLFNCGGFGMEATFFIVMVYSHTLSQSMTALSIGVAFSGFAISGFNVNHLDIAPRYASILMGMSNGIGTIAGCICPFVVHLILPAGTKRTAEEWRVVFVTSAFIHYAGVIFYAIFASGELQEWADPSAEEEKQWNQMNENVQLKKQNNGLLQENKANYGSVETPLRPPSRQTSLDPAPQVGWAESVAPAPTIPVVPSGNPFRSGNNPFRQEPVQPEAQDTYMHGTVYDRTY